MTRVKMQLSQAEKSIDSQQQMFIKLQNEMRIVQNDKESLIADKRQAEQLESKMKTDHEQECTERDIRINTSNEAKEELERKVDSLQQMLAAR